MYVTGIEGHAVSRGRSKSLSFFFFCKGNKWEQSSEPRANRYLTAEEKQGEKGGGIKTGERSACAYSGVHSEAVDTATGVCARVRVPVHKHSACSLTCVSNERWTDLLSILSSQKSAMMSPWTHTEPTSVKKHYSSPPSPSMPHFLFHLSLMLRSCFLDFSRALPFFVFLHANIFPYSPNVPSAFNVSFSPFIPNHTFLSGNYRFSDWPEGALTRQKCQDVLINFVQAAVFCGENSPSAWGHAKKIKAYGKKQEWGERKWKKGEGMREYWGKVWWGQREGSQRTTYGSDSVITANLWAQKERSSFPCLFPCT